MGKFDKIDLREHLAKDEFDILTLPGPGTRPADEPSAAVHSADDGDSGDDTSEDTIPVPDPDQDDD